MIRLALLIALTLAGCAPRRPAIVERPAPEVTSISLCRDMDDNREAWEREAARRFDRPVVLLVHGETVLGRWMAFPDGAPPLPQRWLASFVKASFPGRPIVLMSCNPGRLKLGVPGVWYSRELCWVVPNRNSKIGGPWRLSIDGTVKRGVGDIWEFVSE